MRSHTSLAALPDEVLLRVFSLVDPATLHSLALVCRAWNRFAHDNSVWYALFQTRFPGIAHEFAAVSRSASWEDEYRARDTVADLWSRGRATRRTYSLASEIGQASDVAADFGRDRLTAFEPNSGRIVGCRLSSGGGLLRSVCDIPSGCTAYAVGEHFAIFGNWDGTVHGSLVNHRNILLVGVRRLRDAKHPTMVTAAHICPGLVGKEGTVGALTGDQKGYVCGWDLKTGKCLLKFQVGKEQLVRIESDGKSVVVFLNSDGEIYLVRNAFGLTAAGQNEPIMNPESVEVVKMGVFVSQAPLSAQILVDYGGENIVVYDEHSLDVFSWDPQVPKKALDLGGNDTIGVVSLEKEAQFTTQDDSIVGGDPLLLAVLLTTGTVIVTNIRDRGGAADELDVITCFTPSFVTSITPDENATVPAATAVTVSRVFVAVGSREGHVEVHDVNTGLPVRTVSERVSRQSLMAAGHAHPIPVSRISLDENKGAGLAVMGPIVQFFTVGDLYSVSESGKKKNRQRPIYSEDIGSRVEDYEYEVAQEERQYAMLDRYNGEGEDGIDEMAVALALSASLATNETSQETIPESPLDEEEQLRRAIELSKSDVTRQRLEEEQVRLAMQMSLAEARPQEGSSNGMRG